MARRDVDRRRRDRPGDGGELGDLDVRIVGTPAVADAVAEMLRGRGVTVRGPYPRRDEPGRVSYYARLAAGEALAPAPALPARPAIAGPPPEGS